VTSERLFSAEPAWINARLAKAQTLGSQIFAPASVGEVCA